MTDLWPREHWRAIDGNLWRRWLIQIEAKRTARLKAVPSAAWLGVGGAVFLVSGQCCADGSVPLRARTWQISSGCLARGTFWAVSDAP